MRITATMLPLITLSLLLLAQQSLGSEYLDKLLKTHPTWSFELVSVDSLVKDAIGGLKAVDPNLTEDILRAKIKENFGPDTTHLARKVGDPKWPDPPPATFDARQKWKECAAMMDDLEDEGACFTDGPVVAASVASDRYCIYSNGTSTDKLSAEMLSGCAESCTREARIMQSFRYIADHGIPSGGPYKSNKGCLPYSLDACKHTTGNNSLEYGQYMASKRIRGLGKLKPCEDIMTYDHFCPTECSNRKYSKSLDEDLKKFTTWYILFRNEFQIRSEIFTYGPVATSIILFDDFFQYPEKGMYQKKPGSKLVAWDKYFKLIGWGEQDGIKYWLAVNTWDNWGPTKVFKIPRGINYVYVEYLLPAGVFYH